MTNEIRRGLDTCGACRDGAYGLCSDCAYRAREDEEPAPIRLSEEQSARLDELIETTSPSPALRAALEASMKTSDL